MFVSLTYPRQRNLLVLWGRWYRLCECHLGTRLPCFLQPDDQRLPLKQEEVFSLWFEETADSNENFNTVQWLLKVQCAGSEYTAWPKIIKKVVTWIKLNKQVQASY